MMDAWNRLMLAEESLKRNDYAGAIREAQAAIELASKSLLDKLNVDYSQQRKGKKKFYPHDVSDKISEAFEKLRPHLEGDWEIKQTRVSLAMIAVTLKLLTKVGNCGQYGIKIGEYRVKAGEIFSVNFSGMTKGLITLVHISLRVIEGLIQKLSRS